MTDELYIQSYFANTLSQKKRKALEHRLKTDEAFKTQFDEYKKVHEAFQYHEKIRLKQILKAIDAKEIPVFNLFQYFNKYKFAVVAAILVIGFFVIQNLSHSEILYEDFFDVYPNTHQPVVRGDSKSYSGFEAYETGKFAMAETIFLEQLKVNYDNNIKFYYGLSLLNQNKFKASLKVFKSLENKKFNYKEELYWYMALIYIHNKDYETSKKYLLKLKHLKSKFKLKESRKILNVLE